MGDRRTSLASHAGAWSLELVQLDSSSWANPELTVPANTCTHSLALATSYAERPRVSGVLCFRFCCLLGVRH